MSDILTPHDYGYVFVNNVDDKSRLQTERIFRGDSVKSDRSPVLV